MERMHTTGEIVDILELGQDIVERVGDCPNLERRVNPDNIFWKTVSCHDGLILQTDCLSTKARIVDSNRIQKANGSITAMREKMERLTSREFLREGDVIGVSRGAYEHYAIYSGNGKVIHYAGETADFNGEISIHEAPFEEFLKNSTDYFVVSLEGRYPVKIHVLTKFISCGYFDFNSIKCQGKYSSEETLKRAYSRLGERRYSIVSNNCEHFAMWCKTGNAESTQVRRIVKYVIATGAGLDGITESRNDIFGYLVG